MAESYVTGSTRKAGAAAEVVASRKEEKYGSIGSQYLFAPITVETLGLMNTSACKLFANLGIKISSTSGDERKEAFFVAESFGAGERYNAVFVT